MDSKNSQTTPATTSTSSIRQLLGAADTQTAHHATFSTAPTHQLLGSANAETTPARALAAAADRKQQPAKGRMGDCPGPRKGATTRGNVTQGGQLCIHNEWSWHVCTHMGCAHIVTRECPYGICGSANVPHARLQKVTLKMLQFWALPMGSAWFYLPPRCCPSPRLST